MSLSCRNSLLFRNTTNTKIIHWSRPEPDVCVLRLGIINKYQPNGFCNRDAVCFLEVRIDLVTPG
jgi:hypothetical protein